MASGGDVGFSVTDIKLCNWLGTSREKSIDKRIYRISNRGSSSIKVRAALKNCGGEVTMPITNSTP